MNYGGSSDGQGMNNDDLMEDGEQVGGGAAGGAGGVENGGGKKDDRDNLNKRVRVEYDDKEDDEKKQEQELKDEVVLVDLLEKEDRAWGEFLTYKAIQLSGFVPGTKSDDPLLDCRELEGLDGTTLPHHCLIQAVAKFAVTMQEANKDIKVCSSKLGYLLTPNVFFRSWSNARFKKYFNYSLKPLQSNRAVNFWVSLLVNYTCAKALYAAKMPIILTLDKERIYIRPHTDATLTMDVTKIDFFTRHHPKHVNLGPSQGQLHKEMNRLFMKNQSKCLQLIKQYNLPRLSHPL